MNEVLAFPHNGPQRCLSEERLVCIYQLRDAVKACQRQMNTREIEGRYFQQLLRNLGNAEQLGINLSTFGRLTAASENWLQHYAAEGRKSAAQRVDLADAQNQLRALCKTMRFGRIATYADIIAYQREVDLQQLRIVQ